jgi:pyruvate dehydrogenase E1 component beta subunit
MAVGMAMNGMRPVIEMQFDAFAYPAFEQIVSHVAKMHNRTKGTVKLPIVIRVPYAGGIGGVEHHCDSSEAYYAHRRAEGVHSLMSPTATGCSARPLTR